MKSSRYVKFITNNDGELFLCNLFSEAVLFFPKGSEKIIKHLLSYPNVSYDNFDLQKIKNSLYKGGFLIDDNFDEREKLKERFVVSASGRDNFSIQVAVTLQCNFRCPYCYEKHESISLSQIKQDALVEFVRKNIKNWKRINFSWFGGEPLLNPEVIENVSLRVLDICRDSDALLEGFITTNGFLLNEKNAAMLKRCHIRESQITIDGDRDTHNARRFLVDRTGTFDQIVKNLFVANEYLDRFRIRINVDSQSKDNMLQVIDLLDPLKEKIWLAFLPVQQVNGYCNETISYEDFRNKVSGLNELAAARGFRVSPGYRLSGATYCGAYNKQYILLDPRGDVHRCVVMTGKHQYRAGYLSDNGELVFEKNANNMWNFSPFEDKECFNCDCLPLCMGGCQNLPFDNKNRSGRCGLKDNLERNLLMLIENGYRDNIIGRVGY